VLRVGARDGLEHLAAPGRIHRSDADEHGGGPGLLESLQTIAEARFVSDQ
jgi:hypothetical protein